MTVSLVIPCFQEEEALEAFVALLPSLPVEEVLFVDDGSTDGTPGRLRELAAADPRVRVLTHERNRGVGAAMRTGLRASRGAFVVVYDADRTYPPEDIVRLLEAVAAGADVATASPFAPGGDAATVPLFRRLVSRAAAGAYRLVLGPGAGGIATFTCAFRAYPGPWIRQLPLTSDGFPAAAEILGRAVLQGLRVVEVPSRLGTRREGRSKMRFFRAARGHLGLLARLWRLRLRAAGR